MFFGIADRRGGTHELWIAVVMLEYALQPTDRPRHVHPVDAGVRVRLVDREQRTPGEKRAPSGVMSQICVHADEVRDDDVCGLPDVFAAVLGRVAVVHVDGNVQSKVAEERVEFLFLIPRKGLRRIDEQRRRGRIGEVVPRDLDDVHVGFA